MMITDVYVERPNPQLYAFRGAPVRAVSGGCILSGLFTSNLVNGFFALFFATFFATLVPEGSAFRAGRPSRSRGSVNRCAAAT
jgi:hypothetical protein